LYFFNRHIIFLIKLCYKFVIEIIVLKKSVLNIFVSLVALIYVFSTVGVSVISHYCGGELEEISIYSKSTSCCDVEDVELEKSDCCKNEIVHVAFQKDFTFYTLVKNIKAPLNELFILNPQLSSKVLKYSVSDYSLADKKIHPPNLIQQDIVSSSVIRI